MVRSLYAGISGLRSHQVALDVTGNNIANVNTVGFKAGRATFKEAMAQTLQGPSRPAGNTGGMNPLQVGLGTSIGSIDTMLRQGNLQTTGQITDLALEGRAYFAFSSGKGTFYSRNGGMHLDSEGYLVSPTNGWRLQGKMANAEGNYPPGTGIGDIRIPWGEKAPAKATAQIGFSCNLNMDSQELGTVTHTNSFLRSAALDINSVLNQTINTSSLLLDRLASVPLDTDINLSEMAAQLESEISARLNLMATAQRKIEQNNTDMARFLEEMGKLIVQMTEQIESSGTVTLPSNFDYFTDTTYSRPYNTPGDPTSGDNPNYDKTFADMQEKLVRARGNYVNRADENAVLSYNIGAYSNGGAVADRIDGRTYTFGGTPPALTVTVASGDFGTFHSGTAVTSTLNTAGFAHAGGTGAADAAAAGAIWYEWPIGTAADFVITPPSIQRESRSLQRDLEVIRTALNEQMAPHMEAIGNRTALTSLFDANGNSLGIKAGDVLTITTGNKNLPDFQFTVLKDGQESKNAQEGKTLEDLRKALEGYLNGLNELDFSGLSNKERNDLMNSYVNRYDPDNPTRPEGMGEIRVGYNADGSFTISNNSTDPNGLHGGPMEIPRFGIDSSRPGSRGYVSTAFGFTQPIYSSYALKSDNAGNTVNHTATDVNGDPLVPPISAADLAKREFSISRSGAIFIPAVAEDLLVNLRDAKGKELNLQNGDEIDITGNVGGRGKSNDRGLEFSDGTDTAYGPATTMQDLMDALQNTFNLGPADGTIYNRPSVSIKQAGDGTDDTIPIGSIVLRGTPGLAFALKGLSVQAKDNNVSDPPPPTAFSSNMSFVESQAAREAGIHTTSGEVYDQSGAAHMVMMTFIPLQTPGEWMWELSIAGDAQILSGGSGKVTFGQDGSPASFTFDDNSNGFRFDPMNGAETVEIKIDHGSPGSFMGITQFKSPTTTEMSFQDGYPMGKLEEIFINEKGEIAGKYTNGISKAIAQIYLAEFNNPAGLLKTGDSMFAVSSNSGQAVMYQPGAGTPTTIRAGALEMSNVELETEFTNMITIQRGYQANSRVISTSDSLLQELVQLVR
ncbi:MAG: flagellar hook-basal body complex protein [Chitinispirillales bacterium]|jgi:flagellar hook protein FlgE|nr:flagellar hook-basal body complex protein [Chitinispirillales bacterium]